MITRSSICITEHTMSQNNFNAPSSNWADGSTRRKDATAWVPAMFVGALLFAIGCGSGLVAGWFAGSASGIGSFLDDFDFEPANIGIVHDAPQTMMLGESVVVTISINDTAGKQRILNDIDWSGTLVDNIDLSPLEPTPNSDSPSDSYREFIYAQPLDANGTADFTFELTPRQVGIYHAEITVYVDDYNSDYTSITIEVLAPTTPSADD